MVVGKSPAFMRDSDVEIYRTNVVNQGGSVSVTTLNALDIFVMGLKSDGVWTKIKWLAPFCGDDLTAARVLLKKPAGVAAIMANSGSFVSGDYAETGAAGGLKGNGTSKYLDSGYNPVSQSDSVSDFHLFAYVRGPISNATSRAIAGGNTAGSDVSTILGWLSAGTKEVGQVAGTDAGTDYSPTPGTQPRDGFLGVTVNGNRSQAYYYDGAALATAVTSTGSGHPNGNFFIAARNRGGSAGVFDVRYIKLVSIGTGLSATDATNFFLRSHALQIALSRQSFWRSDLLLSGGRLDAIADLGGGVIITGSRSPTAGHIYKSTDYGTTWSDKGDILSDDVATLKTNGSTTVFAIGGVNAHLWKSTDSGDNWSDLGQVSANAATATFLRTYGLCVTTNGSILVADTLSTGGHIFRSTDGGENFTDIGPVGTGGRYRFDLVAGGILVNGLDGKVYKSTDDGQNWTLKLTSTGPTAMFATDYLGSGITLQADDAGRVYRSTDNGDNWTDLGVIGTKADDFWPGGGGVVYYSTYAENYTVYRSSDLGATWSSIGLFSPLAPDSCEHAIYYKDASGLDSFIGVSNKGYIIRGISP